MKFKYIALLVLTTSSTLLSCGQNYAPKKYYSLYNYRQYQRNSVFSCGTAPLEGECELLVIPIWFTDSYNYITDDTKKENVISDIEKAYFGTMEEVGWYSVASFYERDSFGHSKISGVVSPWFECGHPSTDYYSSESDMTGLLNSAIKWYKQYSGVSKLLDFDKDGDGFLDGVSFIYAAPDATNLPDEDAENLWGYTSWTGATARKTDPQMKNFFWASYDFMYDEETAYVRAGTDNHRGDCSISNIDPHCFIHEFGHNYGLPDYYDYVGDNFFSGGFTMQDHNVGAHDPFSRYALGWTSPYIPTQSCTIKLKPIEQSGESILLAPTFTQSCFDEYIMVEYYTPEGLNEMDANNPYRGYYPSGLTKPGIRIWHIDARLLQFTSNGSLKDIVTDASLKYLYPATSNDTYNSTIAVIVERYHKYADRLSVDFHTLTLLRNDIFATYQSGAQVCEEDLFYAGDTFSISEFPNQFAKENKFNNGMSFTWKVEIKDINSEYATIKLTK